MNTQINNKVATPILIGFLTVVLSVGAGLIALLDSEQVVRIPETRAVTLENQSRMELATAFRDAADAAALQTELEVEADLAVQLKHAPVMLIARYGN